LEGKGAVKADSEQDAVDLFPVAGGLTLSIPTFYTAKQMYD
jgi:hypothetical protein